MNIVFFASEAVPFSKTGGLADVAGSLPAALAGRGHRVTVVTPCYRSARTCGVPSRRLRTRVSIPRPDGTQTEGTVLRAERDGVVFLLLEQPDYFDREGLYGTPAGDYPDNARRFGFFCRAGLELLKLLDIRPDLLHCHDWQTALIPYLLRYRSPADPFFADTATLYTIHNLAFQGLFPPTALPGFGLDESHFTINRMEFYGSVSLMKGGILAADAVSTVSPGYCREILTPEFGCGLEGVLAERRADLYGVLNGIDTSLWDPSTDPDICRHYSARSPAARKCNRRHLQRMLGLTVSDDIPVLAMVSRMTAQKGLDLLEPILPWLAAQELQLVLLGTGDAEWMERLSAWQQKGIANFSFTLKFDNDLAQHIYAGSDIFLMPSRYEPCGLGQLIALRYGSVPVVHRTGGLADTVADSRDGLSGANGFCFDVYIPEAFRETIGRALTAWQYHAGWQRLVRNAMLADHSWNQSASRYEELYRHYGARRREQGYGT